MSPPEEREEIYQRYLRRHIQRVTNRFRRRYLKARTIGEACLSITVFNRERPIT